MCRFISFIGLWYLLINGCSIPNQYNRCVVRYNAYEYYTEDGEKLVVSNPGRIYIDSNRLSFDPDTVFVVNSIRSTKAKTIWRDDNLIYTLYWPRNKEFSIKFNTFRKTDIMRDMPTGNMARIAENMGEEVQYSHNGPIPPFIYKFYVTKVTIQN